MRTLVDATLSTPTVVAAQELDAWTAGHPLGDQPSAVSTPVLLIDSEDTFSSAELIRDVVAPRFTDAAQSTYPAPATGPTSNNPPR